MRNKDPFADVCPSTGRFRLPDGEFLSAIAVQPPAVLGLFLKEMIRIQPQALLASPPLIEFMAKENLRDFSVDSIDVQVSGFTVGHAEIHSLMLFQVRETPSTTRCQGRGIRGGATVILMRDGTLVLDVKFAEVLLNVGNN